MAHAFEKLFGFIILAIGLAVGCGWLLNQDLLNLLNLNFIIMVFNTAACFVLCGAALLLPYRAAIMRRRCQLLIAAIVIAFAGATLAQDVFNIDLGIDQLFAHVGMNDYNPHPGRMAPPSALCFILCGVTFLLLNLQRSKIANLALQTSVFVVMMIAIICIAASAVRLELLYDWYKYGRMAVPTAICFLLLSVIQWISWYHQEARAGAFLEKQERRISITGFVIITLVALSAGMSGFGILANQMENTLEVGLTETNKNYNQLVRNDIELSLSGMVPINTRLLLRRNMAELNKNPDNAEAKAILTKDMDAFISNGVFLGVSLKLNSGQTISQVGNFTQAPELTIPLKSNNPKIQTELLWKDGVILRAQIDTEMDGEKIGTATVERRLHYIDALLSAKQAFGDTGETRICYPLDDQQMQCLASNRHAGVFPVEPRIRTMGVTSMDLALRAQTGIRVARDYLDHQVVSAYGPVGDYGLGMVVKIDAAEFYAPIRLRLEYAVGLVLVLSLLGVFLQSLQLLPLVKRLVKSEERVKSIMTNVADGIIAVNEKGYIESVNPALCHMFGHHMDALIGQNAAILLPERMHALEYQGLDSFLRSKEAIVVGKNALELPAQHKDGHEFTIILTISALQLDEEKLYVGSIRDITENKRLEKLKNEFISTVSHELRTPLTSIRGSLGLIRAGVAGVIAPKAKEMTDIAYNNCERLILLINDILDIDKIESGEMRFDYQNESINNLIQQSVEANQSYAERFDVRFNFEPVEPGAHVHVDASRFIQVLSNLLSNAAKFSTPGTQVEIRATQQASQVHISVADTGPGIPQNFQQRIFSKFAQADSSSSRQKAGTGLGLHISKQIIEHMGGLIGFASEINSGTTFWVILPLAQPQKVKSEWDDAIEYLSTDEMYSLPRILHAEDDYDFCRIISHALHGKAIVHAAATVADAMKLLRSNAYDMLVLDIGLPDGSGLKLVEQIREENRQIKVVLLSAQEVSGKVRSQVAAALVKSRVSEEKIVDTIMHIVKRDPLIPPEGLNHGANS